MSIIDYALIKYMLFCTYLNLLPLTVVYFVLENNNFVLELFRKIIFPWLWEPYDELNKMILFVYFGQNTNPFNLCQ